MTVTDPQPAINPGLGDRVKNILMKPSAEWDRIDGEPATIKGLYTGYIMILAAIGPVCSAIGLLVFGIHFFGVVYRPSPVGVIAQAVVSYVLALVMVAVLALIIEALAPTFGGQKDRIQAFKVATYSATASWLAGVFSIVPMLSILGILGLYSLYLMYLGLPKLMKTARDKALPYTALVIVAAIVLALVIGLISAPLRMLGGDYPPAVGSPTTVGALSAAHWG